MFLYALCFVLSMLCSQESNCKTHKASKVLFLGNLKMLFTSGNSRYNDRQFALWDQVRANDRTVLHDRGPQTCLFCALFDLSWS